MDPDLVSEPQNTCFLSREQWNQIHAVLLKWPQFVERERERAPQLSGTELVLFPPEGELTVPGQPGPCLPGAPQLSVPWSATSY